MWVTVKESNDNVHQLKKETDEQTETS